MDNTADTVWSLNHAVDPNWTLFKNLACISKNSITFGAHSETQTRDSNFWNGATGNFRVERLVPKFSTKSQLRKTSFTKFGQFSAIKIKDAMSSSSTCSRWSSWRFGPLSTTSRSTLSLWKLQASSWTSLRFFNLDKGLSKR